MSLKATFISKQFWTLGTAEGFFTSMNSFMCLQGSWLGKRFRALRAAVRFPACMNLLMKFQFCKFSKCLWTMGAAVWFLDGANQHIWSQTIWMLIYWTTVLIAMSVVFCFTGSKSEIETV
jgi:hypothetical protein